MRVCDGICALVIIINFSENIVCCVYDEVDQAIGGFTLEFE